MILYEHSLKSDTVLLRGVAEGITEGAVNYSGFPPAFLALGQGYLWGGVPAQLQ